MVRCLRTEETTQTFHLKTSNFFFLGLKEVHRRIPFTKGLGLEEAEAAIRAPPPPQAVFPFRNDAADERSHATPSHSASYYKKRGAGNTHPSQTGDIEPDDKIQTSSRPGTAATNPRIDPEDTTRVGPPKTKKGTVKPHHSLSVQKYSCSLIHGPVRTLLQNSISKNASYCHDPKFANACLDLVSASLARNTWKRYNSALRLWKNFQSSVQKRS